MAGRTRYALEAPDIMARWNGDQFLVVLAGDLAAATPTLALITDKANAHPIRTGSGLLPGSMSVGAAAWSGDGGFDEACARARRAMHAAKSRGGRCLVIDDPPGR